MEKYKKYIDILKELFNKYKDKIKIVILPCIVLIAILFFWFSGNSNEGKVVYSDEDKGTKQTINLEGSETKDSDKIENKKGTKAFVDIGGAVLNPGVYEVEAGTRLFKVIELAGGLLDNANVTNINQAKEVFDGEKVIIPNIYESINQDKSKGGVGASQGSINENEIYNYVAGDEDRININMADANSLQTIPGIGPSKAKKIIEYRNINGPFKSIDEIKNISGIGEKTFNNIKDFLCT